MKRDSAHPIDDDEVARLRVPPQAIEAEQSVLGALMLSGPDAFDRVGDLLTESDFYRFEHRLVFKAIGVLAVTNKETDVVSVFERLRQQKTADEIGGIAYLNAMAQSVPSASNLRRHAEIVRERAVLRRLIEVSDEMATNALNTQGAAAQAVLDRAVDALDRLQRSQVQHKPREVAEIVVQRIDAYNALAEGTIEPGMPTGLRDIDAALNGGLQSGRLYVLAARPSIGKSSLATQIAIHRSKAGDRVLLCTMEMPSEECADRCVCNLGLVDYGRIQRGELNDDDWSGISQAADELHRLPLSIDDQPALRLADIRAKAMTVRRELGLIVIDYLQLMTGTVTGKGITRNAELEEITRGLKALAKQLRIPIVLLSQLSREVERRGNPEPTLADLRDSGAIEQDADVVLFLWHVRYLNERRVLGMSIAKNRQGRSGVRFALEFRGAYQRWVDSTADITTKTERKHSGGFE